VVVPDANSLDLTSGMTVEAWVYPRPTLSDWKAILQKEADAWLPERETNSSTRRHRRDVRGLVLHGAPEPERAADRTSGRTSQGPTTARRCACT
jgi:hypothetical protein